MTIDKNSLGQPIGYPMPEWTGRPRPPHTTMTGVHCSVEPLSAARHAQALYTAYGADTTGEIWTYLPYGPFEQLAPYTAWVAERSQSQDPQFYGIVDKKTGKAAGIASYLRIEPAIGVIEVGHINYAPSLQKTTAATEAMYLMMRRAFDELGYRRYEWKCDSLNAGSRQAAQRLGFVFEGIFRQASIYKERSRDTAWYAIIDSEWPRLKAGYEAWLSPDNFTDEGQQRQSIGALLVGV